MSNPTTVLMLCCVVVGVVTNILLKSIDVNLRFMNATVEFVRWGGVCTVIFVSNPTTVFRLCCVVVGVVTIVGFPRHLD